MPEISTTPKPRVNRLKFVNLSTVQAKPIQWLWHPYIPKGALTILAGDGGYGKSWMTCALAADLSQGRPLPGQEPLPPQRILMLSAEDDIGEVIRPKMDLLQANMGNIEIFDQGFILNEEIRDDLIEAIEKYDAAMVFLDPLVVYMGGKVDMFRANETRAVLNVLREVALRTKVAVVAVHHVRKSGEGSAQNKIMGSADFVNGARSTLLVDISKGGQRYMSHVKSNWAANGPTMAYRFGKQGFEWQGQYDVGPAEVAEVSRTPRGEAGRWLREQLRDGPLPAAELIARAENAGFSERTLARAKVGVAKSMNVGGMWVVGLEPAEMERIQVDEGRMNTPKGAEEALRALAEATSPFPRPPVFDDAALEAAKATAAAYRARKAA